ncbi:MAG: hypothetical protein DMG30_28625 [Acidobacteria bacterium]|nr:MAG: hypothetical protein DMG30_28625 [Acidobacteriota bacterium]
MDDNSVARKSVRSFLNWHDFRVCGEAHGFVAKSAAGSELVPTLNRVLGDEGQANRAPMF